VDEGRESCGSEEDSDESGSRNEDCLEAEDRIKVIIILIM